MLNLTHLARTINSLIVGKILSKQNKMADLLFPLIDPQIRERKFQQREIDLDELTDEELLGNLLPDLTFFLFVILFVSFDWITSICFFTLSVIMETSSGEKFGFLFLSFTSLSSILFSSPAPQSAPIFRAIFFQRQAVEKLVKPVFI